jgi:hypothetical protein
VSDFEDQDISSDVFFDNFLLSLGEEMERAAKRGEMKKAILMGETHLKKIGLLEDYIEQTSKRIQDEYRNKN